MTQKLFSSGLFAGLAAGLVVALLQFLLTEPLILEAEEYESGAKVHFAGVAEHGQATNDAHDHSAHEHGTGEAESSLWHRFSLAFGADFIAFVAWGLILVAGFAMAERFGKPVSQSMALMWGAAGFTAVHIATGVGMPPELPGTPTADLQARQIWWSLTVLFSAGGLAILAYAGGGFRYVSAAALLVLPHLIGAPRLAEYGGVAPPELASEFVARSYAVALVGWATLGAVAGYFWNRSST